VIKYEELMSLKYGDKVYELNLNQEDLESSQIIEHTIIRVDDLENSPLKGNYSHCWASIAVAITVSGSPLRKCSFIDNMFQPFSLYLTEEEVNNYLKKQIDTRDVMKEMGLEEG